VEMDTLLPCGEALFRTFSLGKDVFLEQVGKSSATLWLPDVFGYSGCLPQIMRMNGVRRFFTTKLTWGNLNAFPYSSFRWRGIDGSEVVSHVTQSCGYNSEVDPTVLNREARSYHQADVHDAFLVPTGYGDGGGGPTAEMCERASRLGKVYGYPSTAWGSIEGFFDSLESIREQLPVYQGELYFEYHRGTYTTHHFLKAAYRRLERHLRSWEAAHAVRHKGPVDPSFWKRLCFAQFHDYLPGSSVAEVYQKAIPELEKMAERSLKYCRETLEEEKGEAQQQLFNALPMARKVCHEGTLYELPPLGSVSLERDGRQPEDKLEATEQILSNSRLKVTFDSIGRITRMWVDEKELSMASPGGELWQFSDNPHAFEAWDIDRQNLSRGEPWRMECGVPKVDADNCHAQVTFRKELRHDQVVVITYRIQAECPFLEIIYEIENLSANTLLKTVFPTGYMGRFARFGAPFGSVLRSQQPGHRKDEAMFESPGSRWAVVMDDAGQEGLFMATESKYGFSCREGVLSLSLMRTPLYPFSSDYEDLRDKPIPRHVDQGCSAKVRLVVGALNHHSPADEFPPGVAESFFDAPLLFNGISVKSPLHKVEAVPSLQPYWVQPVDAHRQVLVLQETFGRGGKARLILEPGWEAEELSLPDAQGFPLRDGSFEFRPYSIHRIRLSKPEVRS